MELIYTNNQGLTATLRQSPPFFLTKLDGTGSLHNDVTSFRAPSQDGAFFVGSALDMRNIIIEGTIVAATADEAHDHWQQLLRVFTPKALGTLQYRNRKIGCVVEDVKLVVSNLQRLPSFMISLLCPSPFFESLSPVREELALWIRQLEFILEIPSEKIEFGVRQPNQIITIINIGDVSTGCEVIFSAMGTVVNPELMNVDTGEFVRVNKIMQAGEEIHVFTQFAGKCIASVLHGTETNLFPMLDVASSFLQLAVGTNTLRYDANTGLDLLSVSVLYSPAFLSA